MSNEYQLKLKFLTIIFLLIFIGFIFIWNIQHAKTCQEQLRVHATVVASALWTLNPADLEGYLNLVAKHNNYKKITIFAKQEEAPFIEIKGPLESIIDHTLIQLRLIPSKFHTTPIYYRGETIGRIEVIHLHSTIYLYLYVLLVWGLLWLAAIFFLRTLRDKHTLEERVEERTRELQLNQERLRQSEKMDSIGQLAGGIAHDFNNMLAGILGAAELLHRRLPEGDTKNTQMVNLIKTTAERAAELTSQLLSFSRRNKLVFNSFDLREIIQDTISLLERSLNKQVEIQTIHPDTEIPVLCERSQLQSALLNLGINAGDAMGGKGLLTIKTQIVEFDQNYCTASQFDINPGLHAEISVGDTGNGISPEISKHIFEPFFTTKEQGKGTGLGLAAVYGTICNHHGAITVYSEIGEGTIFHIYLPLVSEVTAKPIDSVHVPKLGSGCILVVDDEEIIRTTTEMTLNDMGYEVLTAVDGEDAVAIFHTKHQQIDLIILDMIMPKMGGVDTFKALRKIDPKAKIIIASGFSKDNSIIDLKDEGLVDFIGKPYHRRDLELIIAGSLQ